MNISIKESIKQLQCYIENENYSGYDPYDALKSPLFNIPILSSNKLLRFGIQQIVKRSLINLRPILKISKGHNPVTLGLCVQAYGYLSQLYIERKEEYMLKAENLINELENLIASGYSGACWGYDFPWEARYTKISGYQPTVVATGIITNALFEYYKISNNQKAIELCMSSANFILKDLNRTFKNSLFCFSYSPFDKLTVFNASMKGVRLLSQVYSVTKDDNLKQIARKAVNFVVNYQNSNGSWYYGVKNISKSIDNYHTGYVLDCLDEYIKNTGDDSLKESLEKGYRYYVSNYFENNGSPKFYNNRLYPVDCTSGSQSILTLTRFRNYMQAKRTAIHLINNMQNPTGYFYFRKYKYFTNKSSFMRWSNAWMFCALTYFLYKDLEK